MIVVNGLEYEYHPNMTVRDVLDNCNYIFPLLIVKVAGEFIPRDQYEATVILDGAIIDVIHLMSGG